MDLLILGGTVFVGRGAAEAALARGHRVTLFHRGSRGTGLIAGADEILGDRDGGLDALGDHRWDAVIDACGYVPRVVDASAQALLGRVGRYLFVSTISVYEEHEGGLRTMAVESPVGTETVDGTTYGPLKVECERVVEAAYGDAATIVRPGLVYGPHDPTNRFPYWVRRFLGGGEVLVPNALDRPLQQIDARDLGNFMIDLVEEGRPGAFDAVGAPSTFGAIIEACQELNLGTVPIYAEPEALTALGVALGTDLPLTYPDGPFMRMTPGSYRLRPFAETLRDTAEWVASTEPGAAKYGMSRERELEAIAALR